MTPFLPRTLPLRDSALLILSLLLLLNPGGIRAQTIIDESNSPYTNASSVTGTTGSAVTGATGANGASNSEPTDGSPGSNGFGGSGALTYQVNSGGVLVNAVGGSVNGSTGGNGTGGAGGNSGLSTVRIYGSDNSYGGNAGSGSYGGKGVGGNGTGAISSAGSVTNEGAIAGGAGGNGTGGNGGDSIDTGDQYPSVLVSEQPIVKPSGGNGGDGMAGIGASGVTIKAGTFANSGTIVGGAGGVGSGGNGGIPDIPNGYRENQSGGSTKSAGIYPGSPGNGGVATGGNGGAGVGITMGGSFTNEGAVTGGIGGAAYGGTGAQAGYYPSDYYNISGGIGGDATAGSGGEGVEIAINTILANSGTITGGAGGSGVGGIGGLGHGGIGTAAASGIGTGGSGGTGILLQAGDVLLNQASGIISGGAAGTGSTTNGFTGTGVVSLGAVTITNEGTINNGIFVFTGAAKIVNSGTINGNVKLNNSANQVTLFSGGVINGILYLDGNSDNTLTLNGSGPQALSAAVTGGLGFTGSLIKQGSGTWTIDEPLTYTGGTVINEGTLATASSADTNAGMGSLGTGPVTVDAGTTLQSDAANSLGYGAGGPSRITINGGTITTGGSNGTNGNFLTTLPSLVFQNGGTVTNQAGNSGNGFGVFLFNGGAVVTTDSSSNTATMSASSIWLTGNNVLNVASGNTSSGIDLAISSDLIGTNGSITKTGTGTMLLSGTNSFDGGMLIKEGSVNFANTASYSIATPATVIGLNGTNGYAGGHALGRGYHSGEALILVNSNTGLTNAGVLTGGAGGDAQGGASEGTRNGAAGTGGNGEVAVSVGSGAQFDNSGSVTGGQGGTGTGGTGFSQGKGTGGNGAAGVVMTGGTLVNSGTISGSTGGIGSTTNGNLGYGVDGINATKAVTLINQGTINGGVELTGYANRVTLFIGSKITGDLNMSTYTGTTLILDGSGMQTWSAAVTGATAFNGALIKQDSGTWTLDEPLDCKGGTVINAGTLATSVTNSGMGTLGPARITINAGGTLQSDVQDSLGDNGGNLSAIDIDGGTITTGGSGNFRTTLPSLVFEGGGTVTSQAGNNGDGSGVFSFNGGAAVTTKTSSNTAIINTPSIGLKGTNVFDVARGNPSSGVDLSIASDLINTKYSSISGALTKTGDGTLLLTGANSYNGKTTVSAGTLLANNTNGSAVGTATLAVKSGATLGGNGFIGAAAIIDGGGKLTPGFEGTGALTFNSNLTLDANATSTFTLNSAANFTSINLIGSTVTYGGTLDVNLANNFTPVAGEEFTLFNLSDGAGSLGNFSSVEMGNFDGGTLRFTDPDHIWDCSTNGMTLQLDLATGELSVLPDPSFSPAIKPLGVNSVEAVPEPSTYALLGLGALITALAWRRRVLEIAMKSGGR